MSEAQTKKKKSTKSKKDLWTQIENNFIDEKPIECIKDNVRFSEVVATSKDRHAIFRI